MEKIKRYFADHSCRADVLWITLLVILFSISFMIWGNMKSVNFCDEVYTYILSNSQNEFLTLQLEGNRWYENGETVRIMAAQDGLDFRQVMLNNKGDVHPPMYYFVIHVLSVLNAGSISKWIGLAANWIFAIISIVALYLWIKWMTKSRIPAVVMALIYITSPAVISMNMLLRMYAMFSMWVVLFVLISYRIYHNGKKWTDYLALCFITFAGFLTQYYFAVFCVLFTGFYGINKAILDKQWKAFLAYVGSLVMAVVFATLFWRTWIRHMFSGYLGGAVKDNAFDLSRFGNSIRYGFIHLFTLLYHRLGLLMAGLLLGMIIYLVIRKVKEVRYVLSLLFTALLYAIAVMHLTPVHLLSYRYFYPVVVLGYCAMVLAAFWTLREMNGTWGKRVFALLGMLLCVFNMVLPVYDKDAVMYVDLKGTYRENMEKLHQIKDIPWIYYGYENSTMTELLYDSAMASRFIMVNALTPFDDETFLKKDCEFILFTAGENAYLGEDVFSSMEQWFDGQLEYEELFNKGNMTVYKVRHRINAG